MYEFITQEDHARDLVLSNANAHAGSMSWAFLAAACIFFTYVGIQKQVDKRKQKQSDLQREARQYN